MVLGWREIKNSKALYNGTFFKVLDDILVNLFSCFVT